jgi:putative aldouronate transport system substrate-binding protein
MTQASINHFQGGNMKTLFTRLIVASLLLLVPLAGVMATGQPATGQAAQEVVPLKLYTVGDEPRDIDRIWEAMNEQLADRIGVTIEPVVIPFSDRQQKYPILLASGENFDLVFLAAWNFLSTIADGAFVPLDDLLPTYGPDLLERIPELGWLIGSYDGVRYMVPKLQNEFETSGLIIREDLRLKYGAPEPTDYASMLAYFKAIKDNEPEIIPYNATPDDGLYTQFKRANDISVTGITAIDRVVEITLADFSTVVNVADQDYFRDYLDFARECYLNGYWSRSVLSNKINNAESFENNRSAALTWNPISAGGIAEKVEGTIPGSKVEYYSFEGNSLVEQVGFKAGYAIYQASRYPEKALTFLNLMHTDETLYRLMWYGEEGVDYAMTPDGKVALPEGKTAADVGYSATYMLHGMYDEKYHLVSATEWPRVAEINAGLAQNAHENILLTFKPNVDPISAEVAAIASVIDTYYMPLIWGVVDPDKGVPELQAALKQAGIDKVIEELQSQLDAFNAAR